MAEPDGGRYGGNPSPASERGFAGWFDLFDVRRVWLCLVPPWLTAGPPGAGGCRSVDAKAAKGVTLFGVYATFFSECSLIRTYLMPSLRSP